MQIEKGNSLGSAPRRLLGGLIIQKQCWTLSLRAKLLIFVAILGLVLLSICGLYPFLAVSDPVPGGIIVIEGWIHDISIARTVNKLDPAHARDVFIVSALRSSGPERESGLGQAEYILGELRRSGLSGERLHQVFCEVSNKDRTYHSAVALRNRLQERRIPVDSLNVITAGPHARRSRLMFQKAFGVKVNVGVIPTQGPDYDPARWWRSSDGVGEVLFQCFAYIYARFFFYP
jgi:hypothetical protein